MTLGPWPRFRAPVTLSWFYFESSIRLHLSVAVIAVSVKPCIIIILNILFKHALWRCPWSRFHTPVTLSWFYVESSIKVCFSAAVIAASVKTCIVIVLDILLKHALWPDALDLDFALEWLGHDFMSSSIKMHFFEAALAASLKPCIVIVLDILFKHTLWSCALDLDFMLQWLCYDFTSSLALKCVSLQQL